MAYLQSLPPISWVLLFAGSLLWLRNWYPCRII
jgi:hypothetical protein